MEIGGKEGEKIEGLKVLDAKSMYIERDNKGKITGFNQYTGTFDTKGSFQEKKVIKFKSFQIAHVALNKIGTDAYGQGIVHPALCHLDNLIQNEKNMQVLLQRKANAPYHAKLGRADLKMLPSADAVSAFGQELQYLNNVHEFATDDLADIKVIDTPDFGKKFEFPVEHNLDMLFFSFQVPEVIMGRGSIPEGLAKVQLDTFQRRVQSIQAELEKVIEQQILKRVLKSNELQEYVEFEWGQPERS